MTGEPAQRIIVYVDTSYLSWIERGQLAGWTRLLNLCDTGKVEIHISKITAEEYRTQHRDFMIAAIIAANATAKSWGKALGEAYHRNRLKEHLEDPTSFEPKLSIPADIEEKSELLIKALTDKKVKIIEPSAHHINNVWRNYFSWKTPFQAPVNQASLSEDTVRQARRKDIPDAWIYEGALDILSSGSRLLFLCKDGPLANAVRLKTADVFKDVEDVLNIIEPPASPPTQTLENAVLEPTVIVAKPAPQTQTNAVAPTTEEATGIDAVIKKIHEEEKRLQVRILGYVSWYEPISKSDLANLLKQKGYTGAAVENTAQQLVWNGLIADTGNNYIPKNVALCKEAAESIMAELVGALDS